MTDTEMLEILDLNVSIAVVSTMLDQVSKGENCISFIFAPEDYANEALARYADVIMGSAQWH